MVDNNLMDEEDNIIENEFVIENNKESKLTDNSDQYILIYNNKIVSSDTKENIQELASKLVFGEHELCNGKPIAVENIIVLKKVKINIGLFLE